MKRLCLTLCALGLASVVSAANWPGWRGPSSNGVAPEGTYPTSWSKTDNVAWHVELGGRGASTPAVWGDNVFITFGRTETNILQAYDRAGKKRWEVEVGKEKAGKHQKASGSNSSPTTDGKHVYAYFKSGDFACVDMQGKVVWSKNLQKEFGEDTLWWDLGTSPVLTNEDVVIACMQTGPSYLVAFNKATGKVHWKADRNLGAPEEAAQAYSTPVVVNEGGAETIYTLGADHATAHSAETGKELWRVGGLNPTNHKYFRSIAGPVVSNGVLIAPYARGATITAIKLGGSGDVTKSHVLWTKEGLGADVPTPAAVGDRVYVCTDKGKISCLDVHKGDVLAQVELPKHRLAYSSSPVLANGKLYVTREDGMTTVVDTADDKLKVVGENELGESVVATPVFVDGRILLRSFTSLYAIGK